MEVEFKSTEFDSLSVFRDWESLNLQRNWDDSVEFIIVNRPFL